MKTLIYLFGDHLSRGLSALSGLDPARDVVLMVEALEETSNVPHHKQKIVLMFSAMRHFAESLRSEGIRVDYIRLDEGGNTGSLTGELLRAVSRHRPDRVVVTEPGEWRIREMMTGWTGALGVPVEIRGDDRFLCPLDEFTAWAGTRAALRMEFFYRRMRRKTGWLMNGKDPEGGRWNYDISNRKALPRHLEVPPRRRFPPDAGTRGVMALVARHCPDNFGDLEPFGWAVTRAGALEALDDFLACSLPEFGIYQDAMKSGEDFLFHSVLSPYLNIGLLGPAEVCEAALDAYVKGKAPLESVEGFIRQILGWREFVRGVYWTRMPDYRATNFFGAGRPLPDFFWTGETGLKCVGETVSATRRNAYAHHIQRLMITGNFALLAGIAPAQVEEWYLAVYADAFEWVELPNTHGMALYADGGVLGSKPYAASGAYIHRMSDFCSGCDFDPKVKLGPGACPFNYLYWNFMITNAALLRTNPRMAVPYKTLERMPAERRRRIVDEAQGFLDRLESPYK